MAAVVTGCALLALLGLGVATEFEPQMSLDAELSEALYAGDGRAGPLDGLLETLTAPGLTVLPGGGVPARRRLAGASGGRGATALWVVHRRPADRHRSPNC